MRSTHQKSALRLMLDMDVQKNCSGWIHARRREDENTYNGKVQKKVDKTKIWRKGRRGVQADSNPPKMISFTKYPYPVMEASLSLEYAMARKLSWLTLPFVTRRYGTIRS